MPQHNPFGTNAFKFDLAQPSGWSYAPGDTIIGHLVRKTPIVTPEATITLSFTGRAKVKITYTRQNSKSVYRDESQLVSSQYMIFKGPLHLPEGSGESLTWPISVNIPLQPQESARRGRDPECSLIPLNVDHPGHRILPGTFYSKDDSFGNPDSTCFVEYYLLATLRYQHAGRNQSHESIHPILIRHPIIDISKLNIPVMLKDTGYVTSQRLLPGMENADLSFKEHMQKFFSSSKVPTFKYALHLTVPTAIQLENPNPIPLQLGIVPFGEGTSENIRDAAQNIRVSYVRMTLRPFTQCIAPGSFITRQYSNAYQTKDDLGLQFAFTNLKSPFMISTGKGNEAVHIGNTFQLTLGATGLRYGGQRVQHLVHVWPDFQTYNIEHHHRMEYTVALLIGGEKKEHKFSNIPMQIIPPA